MKRCREGYVLLIAILVTSFAIMGVIIFLMASSRWMGYVFYNKFQREKKKLGEISHIIRSWYYVQAPSIEKYEGDALKGEDVTVSSGEDWSSVSSKLKIPYQHDEWGSPYFFFVSERLTAGDLAYHNVAVVSAGPNAQLESVFDNGRLVLKGDDLGVAVSGAEIESRYYTETRARVQELAGAIISYAKHVAKEFGNPKADYFCKAGCVPDIPCAGIFDCASATPITNTNVPELLGLPAGMVKDAWGGEFLFDNTFTMQGPPWGFKIGYTPPWGGQLWETFVTDLM